MTVCRLQYNYNVFNDVKGITLSKLMKFIIIPVVLFMIPGLNVTEFSAFATAGAAIAAAWNAYEARKSRDAATRAAEIAEKTLLESQSSAKYSRFQQQFTLLLEQHNQHHAALTKFLDEPEGQELKGKILGKCPITESTSSIYGNDRCSPYMRVLYHLLKHIDAGYYGENDDLRGKKNYSSLVRSLIRNDVLMMIAVNGCYMDENKMGLHPDFIYYHSLLDKFTFFEHTDFNHFVKNNSKWNHTSYDYKNLFEEHFITPTVKYMIRCIGKSESECGELHKNNKNKYACYLLSVIYTYNNPKHDILIRHINNSEKLIKTKFLEEKDEVFKDSMRLLIYLKNTAKCILFNSEDTLHTDTLTDSPEDYERLACKLKNIDLGKIKYRNYNNVEHSLSNELENSLNRIRNEYVRWNYFHAPDEEEQDIKLIRYGMKLLGRRLGYLSQLRPGGTPPRDLSVKTYNVDD